MELDEVSCYARRDGKKGEREVTETDDMEKLFAEWRPLVMKKSDHFVEDGIICQEKWNVASKKILFILKETNGYKRSITDLIHDVCKSGRSSGMWEGPTFHNIGRWAYGLLHYPESVGGYKAANTNHKGAIPYCSFINIKKTTGGRTATSAVDDSAREYAPFLRRQIEIISPEIIVFGGTYRMMKDHVMPEMRKVSTRVHTYKSIVCINAFHPACTKKRLSVYEQVLSNYHTYLEAQSEVAGGATQPESLNCLASQSNAKGGIEACPKFQP